MTTDEPLTEAVKNQLLRRVDWRFLLPNAHPDVSICFGDQRLVRAVSLISGKLIDSASPASRECDLAVAVNPDPATLRAAWSRLGPGGVCYAEWYSPTAGGVRGVRQRLRTAGFANVRCYWAWPWPSTARTRFWVPLEAAGARRYFLGSRPPVPNRLRRFARRIGRSLLTLASLRVVPFPICTVSRKPDGIHADSPTLPDASQAAQLGVAPTRQSWLLLTGGTRTIHKVVGLVFEEPEPRPHAVVKWARVPEAVGLLEKEDLALQAVHRLRPGGIAGVPRVLFSEHAEGGFRLGETALTGAPLYTQLHRRSARALAVQATDWLVDLAGQPRPRPRSEFSNRLLEPVVAEFEATFGTVLEPALLRQTRAVLQSLDSCPIVCEHRDFSPWNILRTPAGELAVLDWEGAELDGLPALDLIYFLAHVGFYLDGAYSSGRYRESYRASLDPSTFVGSIRAEALARYQRRLDLGPAQLAPLNVLVWLVHARSEYQRLVSDAAPQAVAPGRLRRAGFVGLWQEELRQIGTRGRPG